MNENWPVENILVTPIIAVNRPSSQQRIDLAKLRIGRTVASN